MNKNFDLLRFGNIAAFIITLIIKITIVIIAVALTATSGLQRFKQKQ